MRVLVAENNAENALLLGHYLGIFGWHVDTASNGVECVEALCDATTPYDIVLMDIDMPMLDGIKTAERIRAEATAPITDIPIVAVTADWSAKTKRLAEDAGINAYVTKPIDFELLAKTVVALVEEP
jgi:CheY-like chemotaxis protein